MPGSNSAVTTPAPQQSSGPTAQTTFRIDAPSLATTSSATRSPKYVSAATASVSIALTGQAPLAVVNLSPSSPGCTTTTAGTTCTVTVNAPLGQDTFVVTAYGGTNGTGSVLSTATAVATVALNSSNVVALVLNGVVSTATVILGSTSVVVGAPATVAVTVVAYDAAQEIIVGPGNYSSPVTLTDTDASGMTSLSATQVLAPGTNTTLTYKGGSMVGATITPSVGGTPGTSATFAPTGYAFADFPLSAGYIYAMSPGPGDGNVWFAGIGFAGFITPSGSATTFGGLPDVHILGLAPGPNGAEWFGDVNGDVGSITPGGTVTYASNFNTPCESEGTTCGPVNWFVLGPDGNIWFSDDNGYIGQANAAGVTEWSVNQLTGWPGGVAEPEQISFDPDGSLYVADANVDSIYRVTLQSDVPQSVTLVNDGCAVGSLVVGADGNVWFGDSCENVGVVPLANFTNGAAQFFSLEGVTGDSSFFGSVGFFPFTASPGGVWVADYGYALYRISNTGGSGPAIPAITALNPLPGAVEQTLGPDGNIWTAGQCTAPISLARVVYGAPGTGALGVARRLPHSTRRSGGARIARTKLRPSVEGNSCGDEE